MFPLSKKSSILKISRDAIYDLPTPSCLTRNWRFGSLLGLCLVVQLVRGVFLAIHYSCDVRLAFESVRHIVRDVNFGWGLRRIHSNGARIFFIFIYLHVSRGLYYGSYNFKNTWVVGRLILLLVIATAFLGYVLPWGQISFWGATVITNLVSAIPFVGNSIVIWLWGGFAVSNATLTRFFSFHFILPFILAALSIVHLFYLHRTGSSNLLGVRRNLDKTSFHPYFSIIDFIGFIIFIIFFLSIAFFSPWDLGDPENFIAANPIVTPVHIQPEWYFLFAYAILRSIPNKLGGVLALVFSIVILLFIPFSIEKKFKRNKFIPFKKIAFWGFIVTVVLLTWIGARPVEEPYILTGQILTIAYFSYYLVYFLE